LGISCDLIKISFLKASFENPTNKKTIKKAWRFFLLCGLFVTQTYGSSNFLDEINKLIKKN